MKTIFALLCIPLVGSLCFAQVAPSDTISVTVGTGSAACTFTPSSIMDGFTNPITLPPPIGGGSGRATFGPVTIVKNVDHCSVPLVVDLVEVKIIPAVTINITATGASPTLVLTIKLANAAVTSLSDSDSAGDHAPTEKVSLVYETITIAQPPNLSSNPPFGGLWVKCSLVTNTCSSGSGMAP